MRADFRPDTFSRRLRTGMENTMKDTIIIRLFLCQESGVSGPHTQLTVQRGEWTHADARAWAEGQIGHPWDHLIAELYRPRPGDLLPTPD